MRAREAREYWTQILRWSCLILRLFAHLECDIKFQVQIWELSMSAYTQPNYYFYSWRLGNRQLVMHNISIIIEPVISFWIDMCDLPYVHCTLYIFLLFRYVYIKFYLYSREQKIDEWQRLSRKLVYSLWISVHINCWYCCNFCTKDMLSMCSLCVLFVHWKWSDFSAQITVE